MSVGVTVTGKLFPPARTFSCSYISATFSKSGTTQIGGATSGSKEGSMFFRFFLWHWMDEVCSGMFVDLVSASFESAGGVREMVLLLWHTLRLI